MQPLTDPRRSLLSISLGFLQVGATAFGFAMVQKTKSLVVEKGWMTHEEVDEGLALVQLYPGPMMVDFTAYTGYKLRGISGAVVAGLSFILPSFILITILSAAYFASGSLPWVHPLFLGLEALVVGVILNVALDFGGRALKGRIEAVIAFISFAALLLKVNAVLIVLVSLAVGALLLRPRAENSKPPDPHRIAAPPLSRRRQAGMVAVIAVILGVAVYSWSLNSDVGRMGLSFFKIGSVAFGNGTTILPLVQTEIVDAHHWLTPSQFADGVALGQITPGPFLIMAAFVGYKMGGFGAAALMTFAMFSPSFAMTLVFTEIYVRLKNMTVIRGALAGVLASFVGLLAVVVLQLGQVGINGPLPLVMACGAFIGVHYFKLDVVWVFFAGLLVWMTLVAARLV